MLDKQGLRLRAALFASIRQFFSSRGFLEVDTPIRQPFIIPESNILPFTAEGQYLQTSPELCMKRILASGCDRIFQVCPCFRKEERGRLHLEEFTMLEWYRRDADYLQLMDDCEELLSTVAGDIEGLDSLDEKWPFPGVVLKRPWQRLTVEDAFARYSPIPLRASMDQGCYENVLVEYVEPHLGVSVPTFLVDYPVESGALAKRMDFDPAKVERFELYIHGIELANGFSELTDTVEQRQRFVHEIESIVRAGRVSSGMPERFLDDLQELSAAAGIALGVDRLFMLLIGERQLDRVVSFAPDDF